MRIFIAWVSLLFLSCIPVKHGLSSAGNDELEGSVFKISSNCPIEGDCFVKRLKNTALRVEEVVNGNRNEMYYEFLPSDSTDVVIYSYKKATDSALMDGFYREEIIFEVPREKQQIVLQHRNLQDVKMIFGRFCYCKGETGFYKVRRGNASIKYSDRKIKANIDIEVLDVPQLIKSAHFTVE